MSRWNRLNSALILRSEQHNLEKLPDRRSLSGDLYARHPLKRRLEEKLAVLQPVGCHLKGSLENKNSNEKPKFKWFFS